MPSKKGKDKPQVDTSGERTATRNLRKIRPAPLVYSPSTGFRGWEQSGKTPEDVERRRKRRESDARCRANLSTCFSSLRAQVQRRHEYEVKMSKEALLYNSIDQIQYLEAILVLLQQHQDTSSGGPPSKPIDVLQGLHKEFISQQHGIKVRDIVLKTGHENLQKHSSKKSTVTVNSPSKVTVITTIGNRPTSQEVVPKALSSTTVRPSDTPLKISSTPLRIPNTKDRPSSTPVRTSSTTKKSRRRVKKSNNPTPRETPAPVTPDGSSQNCTVPNILLKRVETPGKLKSYYVSTPSKVQQVPGTPTDRGGRDEQIRGAAESGVHQVPRTPVRDELVTTHYRIRGKEVTPSKGSAFDLCGNCQIAGSNAFDLTCYEDPTEWKEESYDELMRTPQRGNPDEAINFRTPTLKRKVLTSPSSTGRRSRKCLFKSTPDKKGNPVIQHTAKSAPTRTYSKRATAARTRPWDAIAWKVTSPYQPYSGIHRQRKESRGEKLQPVTETKLKKSHKELQLKLMQAMGLTGSGAQTGKTIEHGQDTGSASQKDRRMMFEAAKDEECKSNSQDSLSISEVPSLPQNIRNLISSGGGAFSGDEAPPRPIDLTLGTGTLRQLDSFLEDDCYPLEMYPDNLADLSGSCETLPDEENMTFDLYPPDIFSHDPVADGGPDINIQVLSPARAKELYEASSPHGCGEGSLAGVFSEDGQLDGLIRKNVWKGARDQDITLTQLQTEPIFGSLDPVYKSPLWTMTALASPQDCKQDWVDVESGASTQGGHESWDTADLLSSIESGPSGLEEEDSSTSQSSSGNSSPDLEPGCAASRAIEEYQVVPHYRAEE